MNKWRSQGCVKILVKTAPTTTRLTTSAHPTAQWPTSAIHSYLKFLTFAQNVSKSDCLISITDFHTWCFSVTNCWLYSSVKHVWCANTWIGHPPHTMTCIIMLEASILVLQNLQDGVVHNVQTPTLYYHKRPKQLSFVCRNAHSLC